MALNYQIAGICSAPGVPVWRGGLRAQGCGSFPGDRPAVARAA